MIFRVEIQGRPRPSTYQSGDVTPSSWLPTTEAPRPELDPEPNEVNTTSRFKDKPKSQNQHTVVLSNFETNSSEIRRFCRTVVPLFLPLTVVEKSWIKHPQVCYNDMIISTKCFITLATLGGGVL